MQHPVSSAGLNSNVAGRTPDVVLIPLPGVVYSSPTAKLKKVSEHGGLMKVGSASGRQVIGLCKQGPGSPVSHTHDALSGPCRWPGSPLYVIALWRPQLLIRVEPLPAGGPQCCSGCGAAPRLLSSRHHCDRHCQRAAGGCHRSVPAGAAPLQPDCWSSQPSAWAGDQSSLCSCPYRCHSAPCLAHSIRRGSCSRPGPCRPRCSELSRSCGRPCRCQPGQSCHPS